MIAQELEVSLHMAFVEARQKRTSSSRSSTCCSRPARQPVSAAEVLRACGQHRRPAQA